jgi:hypothetical protein
VINKNLAITAATAASPARLRADGIQTAALIQLGRALAAGDTRARDLLDALEDLGKVADGIARDGELDAALDDVRTYARLDAAVMDLTTADVEQLSAQSWAALPSDNEAADDGTVVSLPTQRNRRAS